MENKMKEEMREKRGEMRQVGQCLQAGTARIVAIARSEARTTAGKMATPRAGTSELEGSAPAGEDRVIRETCWTRHEVTERRKLNGVTETCTRHIETKEAMGDEVTELTETREIGERLHGTDEEEDAHTHTHTGSEGR